MPDIDGEHYFLTALVPVSTGVRTRPDRRKIASSHALRETLATLPTALQSSADVSGQAVSPFARCTRTHFVRLFVIDQPFFNGRTATDALVQAVGNTPLLTPQPVDQLSTPWLAVIVDFDARPAEPDGGLASYLEGLWTKMQPEMRAIFEECHDFAAVSSAQAFASYIKRCQVETTMPFNDYWPGAPPLPALGRNVLVGGLVGVAVLLIGAATFALRLLGASLWWLVLAVPAAVLLAAAVIYGFVMQRGRKPFPPAPHSDLPSVLKALYIQQRFARFAATNQGAGAEALYAAFTAFVATEQPANIAEPTRRPGRIDA